MAIWDYIVERLPGSFKLKDGRAFGLGNTTAANLPTCDGTRQNEMRYLPGESGVADRWVVCEKAASDAYEWRDKGHDYLDDTYTGGVGGGSSLVDILMLGGM